jgi:eukaryotic-like serine/threonine-protein kinase
MANRVGQQLGNYQLMELLGQGSLAEVYLGGHIHLGTLAAIKVLHAQLSNEDITSFRREARVIAHLIHPNIVRVLEFGIEDQTPFLVMDFAPHGTVRQRYPRGTLLPVPTVVSVTKQVADALQFAHDERVVHRDVKPENLLLGRRHEVLLSDFGIAVVSQRPHDLSLYNTAGTLLYMAPEQLRGEPCLASDQYALGIVVYEWLCGCCPFQGTSALKIAIQHISQPPKPLREMVPSIPPAVEHVVSKALAKEPTERFARIQDFAETLERASLSQGITASAQSLLPIETCSSTDAPASSSDDPRLTLPASFSEDRLPTFDEGDVS